MTQYSIDLATVCYQKKSILIIAQGSLHTHSDPISLKNSMF